MSRKRGKIYVVGLGPGGRDHLTYGAVKALLVSDAVVGYKMYVELIADYLKGKEVVASGMRQEIERCRTALALAREGKTVALVSSGDPGVYGMAGPMLELNCREEEPVELEIVPGVTAAGYGAAVLGAPLVHDAVFISLSNLLTPWEVIEKRLNLAAEGDFTAALYNPKSQGRPQFLAQAREIFLRHRTPSTPVGIVKNGSRPGQEVTVTTLGDLLNHDVDMTSIVLVGNSQTYVQNGFMITPRGYSL